METISIQLFHTALEDIFLSIEEMPNARLADHLEPFLDVPLLHGLLHRDNKIEAPQKIHAIARIVADTPIGKDMLDRRMIEKVEYGSPVQLIDLAFEPAYIELLRWMEDCIINGMKTLKRKFNPYAIVEVTPRLQRSRIFSLELSIGDDIRHRYFEEQFPSGRYSSTNHNDQVRDVQGVCPDSE